MDAKDPLHDFVHQEGFAPVADTFLPKTPIDSGRITSGGSIVEPDAVADEDGRQYHGYKEGKYFLPNDPDEQDRLDFQHAIIMLLLDGKYAIAPMTETPKYVMDVATGTGIWALEFARENPGSRGE